LSLFVKLCGLRTEADVEAAIAAGADAVGFVLTDSPRRISTTHAARLMALLPPSVLGVAVYHDPAPRLVSETAEVMRPDLHQAEPWHLESVGPNERLPVVVAGPHLEKDMTRAVEVTTRRIALVDHAAHGGTGVTHDWADLASSALAERMIVAGGLKPANVATVVRRISPFGVDVSSGIEREPGEKDHLLMKEFVAAAREAADGGGR
jgi:phosphoribosylanthranilate isomerase